MVLHRQRLYIIISLIVLFVTLSVGVAHALSKCYIAQRMNAIYYNLHLSLDDIQRQVDNVLGGMSLLSNQGVECNEEIYSTISRLVSDNNLIYEAAFKLAKGKICSSYGYEIFELPVEFDWNHYPSQQTEYQFFSDRHVSSGEDFVIVGQTSSYLWLNKAILLGAVNLADGIGLDVIEPRLDTPIFSNGLAQVDPNIPLHIGMLTHQKNGLQRSYIHQWSGLVSVITLPMKQYQIIWWGIFASVYVFLSIFCVLLVFLWRWAMESHFSMVAKLRKAIKLGALNMHYQPIVNMRTGEWVGMEALIRWGTPGSIISPAVFIPLAERAGIMPELTRWVLGRVAEDFSCHLRSCKGLYITINLSAQDIEDDTFVEFVYELLSRCAIPAHCIVFEVSEGALMNLPKSAIQLQRLREQGHQVAIDDFGTGYSSLACIEELPVDILKIDRAFLGVDRIGGADALWRHIVTMASSLKLTVVAEGVEVPEQVEALIDGDVMFAQGWLFSEALPPSIFAKQFNHHCPNA